MEAHDHEKNVAHILRGPKDGKSVSMGGIGVVFKLFGKDTGGAFSIVEHPIRPKALVPPHMHADEDEFSFVVKGKVGARIGDHVLVAGPGSYILKPRNIPHTFWNPGQTMARLVEIISPPGFENFFDEASKMFQGVPDPGKMKELAAKYHTTLGWDEWVTELTKKYKLKLFGR
jgi:quercetin dioxygenase-like cupin family protein